MMPGRRLLPGKVPSDVLTSLLNLPRHVPKELRVAPGIGEDGAVLEVRSGMLVVASDPITFPTPRPGHFAVCVNVNDVAAMGAQPAYYTMTVIAPPGISEGEVLAVVQDAIRTGDDCGVALVGGHTEISDAVSRMIVSVTMFGYLISDVALSTGGARDGDRLMQVNPLALEGTAILAAENRMRLTEAFGEEFVAAACRLVDDPGICVLAPARIMVEHGGVHGLHDPTEGGIATGIREMSESSGMGVVVYRGSLLQLPVTKQITDEMGVDPLGLISSGCLVAAVDPGAVPGLIVALGEAGYMAMEIGTFRVGEGQVMIEEDGRQVPLPDFAVDELAGGN